MKRLLMLLRLQGALQRMKDLNHTEQVLLDGLRIARSQIEHQQLHVQGLKRDLAMLEAATSAAYAATTQPREATLH